MVSFTYTIKDELGIHARPAGAFVKEVMKWKSAVTIEAGTKNADARRLMAIMSMGVKLGNVVTVSADGEDEADCIEALQKFFEENL